MNVKWTQFGVVAVVVMATCSLASADMGLPMIVVYWPPAWLALIPIILLEAVIGRRMLKVSFRRCLCTAGAANIVSTLVGIPVVWLILTKLDFLFGGDGARGIDDLSGKLYAVTAQAPWLIPYESDFWWMVPSAVIVLTIFFYLASVLIEFFIARWFFPSDLRRRSWTWMWKANLASYGLLVLVVLVARLFPTPSLPEWLQNIFFLPVDVAFDFA